MKEFYGYFDPTPEDDRQYVADELAEAFRALGGTGVGKGLEVSLTDGLTLSVGPGSAMIDGYIYSLTEDSGGPKTLTLGVAGSADRIDRVVLRLDLSADAKRISLLAKAGAPGANPVPPAVLRTDLVKEISLCSVRVKASAVSLAAADLTDERNNDTVCGALAPEGLRYTQLDSRYLAAATQAKAGIMTAADKKVLDGLASVFATSSTGADLGGKTLKNGKLAYGSTDVATALAAAEKDIDDLEADATNTQIHLYSHSYDATGKIHKFVASDGKNYVNGRVKITKAFTVGDKFQVNGATVSAYSGPYLIDELPVGRWLTFVYVASEKVVNFKSGGAERNYHLTTVKSASALPDSALENTVSVVTSTEIGDVRFQKSKPSTATAGDVLFLTDTTSNDISLSVSKRDALYVYPVSAHQWSGSSWIYKDAYVYQKKVWRKFRDMIYDHGKFNIKYCNMGHSNRWNSVGDWYEGTKWTSVLSDHLRIFHTGENGDSYSRAGFFWYLNFKPYKRIGIDVDVEKHKISIGAGSYSPSGWYDQSCEVETRNLGRQMLWLDVSDITTSTYFRIFTQFDKTTEVSVYGVYAERL